MVVNQFADLLSNSPLIVKPIYHDVTAYVIAGSFGFYVVVVSDC